MTPTEFFKHLGDDIRLKSLLLIADEGELCVCELMAALGESSQPKISRHLALLKNAGLLLTRKQKQWVFYSINPDIATWAQQLIQLTLKANSNFISAHLQTLHLMGDRPTRAVSCCE